MLTDAEILRMAEAVSGNFRRRSYEEHLVEFARAVERAVLDSAHKSRGTLLFNPYSGRPRHPSDIESDPHGILLVDPEQPLPGMRIEVRGGPTC